MSEEIIDIVIIGGGPAGLTAAIYGARLGKQVTVISEYLGGTMAFTDLIENYPGFPEGIAGWELGERMEEQARRFGVNIIQARAEEIKKTDHKRFMIKTQGANYIGKTIILATGSSPQKLGIPGEERLMGKGVSYCALCDGPLFKDKVVLVVGGGNSAVEEACYLSSIAKQVILLHRRKELRAHPKVQEKFYALPNGIFMPETALEEILGDHRVEEVKLKQLSSGETKKLSVNGVFIYIGRSPNSALVAGQVDLDESGYVKTDEWMRTSVEGIFACGDVRARLVWQVVTATAEGAIAALAANQYIEGK